MDSKERARGYMYILLEKVGVERSIITRGYVFADEIESKWTLMERLYSSEERDREIEIERYREIGRPREIERDLEIFGGREIDMCIIMIILLLDREIVR